MVYKRTQTSITSSYGSCQVEDTGAGLTTPILFGLLNLIILFGANVQAFRARGISDEFSESKYIAIALASILQAIIIGVPVAVMTAAEPDVFSVIVSCFAFIVAMSLSLLIFVPKVLLARKRAKEKQAKKQQGNHRSISATSTEVEESGIRIIHAPTSKRFVKHEVAKTNESQSSQMDEKLQQLKVILTEQGIDTTVLFKEAGIDLPENSEKSSGLDIKQSDDPSNGNTGSSNT